MNNWQARVIPEKSFPCDLPARYIKGHRKGYAEMNEKDIKDLIGSLEAFIEAEDRLREAYIARLDANPLTGRLVEDYETAKSMYRQQGDAMLGAIGRLGRPLINLLKDTLNE